MNRRAFFSSLAAVAATAVMDPERALWVPGKKKIFIPPPPVQFVRVGDLITFAGRYAVNPVTGEETDSLQVFSVLAVHRSRIDLIPKWPPLQPKLRARINS